MNVNAPGAFSGSEMGINGAAFMNQPIKIQGDLIPEADAEEIIGKLQALFARHNAGAALSAKAHQGIPHGPPYAVFGGREYGDRQGGAGGGEREDEAREGRISRS